MASAQRAATGDVSKNYLRPVRARRKGTLPLDLLLPSLSCCIQHKRPLPNNYRGLARQSSCLLGRYRKEFGGVPLAIGGIEDHAHMLIGLRATHRLDYVMRDVKSGSSDWAHSTLGKRSFAWQPGYFGVTVSPSHIEKVTRYILNQEQHHRHKTFKDEYLEMFGTCWCRV